MGNGTVDSCTSWFSHRNRLSRTKQIENHKIVINYPHTFILSISLSLLVRSVANTKYIVLHDIHQMEQVQLIVVHLGLVTEIDYHGRNRWKSWFRKKKFL
eukprot:sb/3478600/